MLLTSMAIHHAKKRIERVYERHQQGHIMFEQDQVMSKIGS